MVPGCRAAAQSTGRSKIGPLCDAKWDVKTGIRASGRARAFLKCLVYETADPVCPSLLPRALGCARRGRDACVAMNAGALRTVPQAAGVPSGLALARGVLGTFCSVGDPLEHE